MKIKKIILSSFTAFFFVLSYAQEITIQNRTMKTLYVKVKGTFDQEIVKFKLESGKQRKLKSTEISHTVTYGEILGSYDDYIMPTSSINDKVFTVGSGVILPEVKQYEIKNQSETSAYVSTTASSYVDTEGIDELMNNIKNFDERKFKQNRLDFLQIDMDNMPGRIEKRRKKGKDVSKMIERFEAKKKEYNEIKEWLANNK